MKLTFSFDGLRLWFLAQNMQHAPHDVSHLLVHKRRRNRSVMMCHNCHNCTNSVTICADSHGIMVRYDADMSFDTLSLSLQDCISCITITSSSTTAPGRSIDLHKWQCKSSQPCSRRMNHFNLVFKGEVKQVTGSQGFTGDSW